MTLGKMIVALTIVFVTLLFIGGIYYPNTLEMSLADTTMPYTILRGVIILLLISILVTNPPRSLVLRGIIGAWSLILAGESLQIFYNYEVRLLDAIVFMQVATILGIEALETRQIPVSKKYSPPRRITVTST
jgi:hypothetical protein